MSDQPSHSDQPEPFDLRSLDIPDEKKQELLRLFPEVRTEGGQIDFERLKAVLGETVDVGKERYGMHWPGKADVMKTFQAPSLGTLLPCPDESVNFDASENLIIEGDNLEVLKLLQKSYQRQVKMIYIDPPYNTGNDFIYPDNYSESLQTYLEYTGQVDAEGKKFGSNTDTDGRFHSKWINMMYPRLYLARNLLREDGVIFISIDDAEVGNLTKLCIEVFGEENFLACLPTVMNLKGNNDEFGFAGSHEYTVVFALDKSRVKLFEFSLSDEELDEWEEDDLGPYKRGANLKATGKNAPRERRPNLFFPLYVNSNGTVSITRQSNSDMEIYPITNGQEMSWRWSKDKFQNQPDDVIAIVDGNEVSLYKKQRPSLGELPSKKPKTLWYKPSYSSGNGTNALRELFGEKLFDTPPKPPTLIEDLLEIGLGTEGIVLDFFAGSGTTAQAVLNLNNRGARSCNYILVQLPEPLDPADTNQKPAADYCDALGVPRTIAEITKERVRRVIMKLNGGDAGRLNLKGASQQDRGFRVFKLAESNFTTWDAAISQDAEALAKQLELHIDHIRDGRSEYDLLYEILLKSGFPVTTPVETLTLSDKTVYSIADGALLICLEKTLTLELIRAMAELKPARVVCLDQGFAGNDQLKTNAVQIFKTKEVASFRTV